MKLARGRVTPSDGADPRKLGAKCSECPLQGQRPVLPQRRPNAKLILLGESPGKTEVYEGRPFAGAAGQWVDTVLADLNISRSKLHVTNTVMCRPLPSMTPQDWKESIAACAPRLEKELHETKARHILACGKASLQATTGVGKITPWIGAPLTPEAPYIPKKSKKRILYRGDYSQFTVLPTFHPTFCRYRQPAYQPVFARFVDRAWKLATGQLKPWKWPEIVVEVGEEMVDGLYKILHSDLSIGVDVETAGDDPVQANLLCIGFATTKIAVSVPWPLDGYVQFGPRIRQLVEEILASPNRKILQNGKHDEISLSVHNLPLRNFAFDTMLAHALIAPELPHDLGFITALEYHNPRHKSEFHVESDSKGMAKFTKADPIALRTYNAKDAFVQVALEAPLVEQLNEVHRGDELMAQYMGLARISMKMQRRGIRVNPAKFKRHRKALKQRKKGALYDLRAIAKTAGIKELNPNSNKLIKSLFFEKLGIRPRRYSEKTNSPKLDEEELQNLLTSENPTAALASRALLRYRRWSKLLSTYIDKLPTKTSRGVLSVRPSWKVHGTITGRWSSAKPNCFDGQTEILTETGWIRLDQYRTGRIAQYDDLFGIRFEEPTAYYKLAYNGPLLHFKNEHIDLRLTPDHRCLTRNRKTNVQNVYPAANYPRDQQQLHGAKYRPDLLAFAELSDGQLRLLAAIQADGHIAGTGVDFSFKKKRKAKRLKEILQQLGMFYRDYSTKGRFRYFIPHNVNTVLRHFEPGKLLPRRLLHLPRPQRELFLEEVWQWDGVAAKRNHYASKHKHNADLVATLCALNGWRAVVRRYQNTRGAVVWIVDKTERDYSLTTNIVRSTRHYTGYVYCVSVPSSYVLVRRNNRVQITGQCQNIPKPKRLRQGKQIIHLPGMRDIFVAREGLWLVEADYSQLELRILALLAGDTKLLAWYAAGLDVHYLNAKELFETAEPTDQERDLAKRFVYAANYGADPETIWKSLVVDFPNLELALVEKLHRRWFAAHPDIVNWQQLQLKTARTKGYVEDPISGRREWLWGNIEPTVIYNFPIQAAAASIINPAVIDLDKELSWKDEAILLQVHDALVLEGKDPWRLCRLLKKHMQRVVILNSQKQMFPVDLKVGRGPGLRSNWGHLRKVKSIKRQAA